MSAILCVMDGMTGPEFRARDYPALAAMRCRDPVATTPPGHDAESLPCILTLLGVRQIPQRLRAYVEALGAGIAVQPDDLLLRVSWLRVADGRCQGVAPGPARLRAAGSARYYPLGGYQGLLILPGQAARLAALRLVPYFSLRQPSPSSLRPGGLAALGRLFDANCGASRCPGFWGAARPASLPPFPQPAAVVCGVPLVRGLARLLGMRPLDIPGATGGTDTDLPAKAAAALRAAAAYPFVLLHINGADEAAHCRDLAAKRRFLAAAEAEVWRPLLASGHAVCIAADHATDPATAAHLPTPQPVFIKAAPDSKVFDFIFQ